VKITIRLLLIAACIASSPLAARAEWQAVEKVEPYSISGKSGPELYASIGERGPKAGIGRVIAYTDFKLTWQRRYEPKDGACTLVSAKPKLIITYRLPKPAEKLPEPAKKLWETFSAGVRAHEKVHGEFIIDMVKAIEAATVGLSVPDDPECSKIRTEMTKRLSALSLAQRQKSRDFDRVELSNGGAVHQLILNLVNGR
jgi:predicted secreted Zn-dependent protease